MNSKRLYFVLLAVVGLLCVGLIGGAYGVDKLLGQASKQLLHNRLQVAALSQEQDQLTKAKQDIAQYQDLGVIAQSVVPQDKDQAEAVRQIVRIASNNGISLSSITFPSSSLGGAGQTSKVKFSQLTPVPGSSGVYDLQITVASDVNKPVPYDRFINFLSALEHNRRTALVSSIQLQPNDKDRSTLSFTLILDEYIKP